MSRRKEDLPFEKFFEFDAIWEATLSYLAHVHETTIAKLFHNKLVYEQILLIRTRLDASYKVGFAFVNLLDKLVK